MSINIQIAVIDSGINVKLIETKKLKNQVIVDESNNITKDHLVPQTSDFLHGTICALIIEKYCSEAVLSSIRILDQNGTGGVEKIEPALEWCCQNDIKIVNLSLGTTNFREKEKLNKLINKYTYKGLIIVAAISNIGYFTSPASFTNVIGVANVENLLPYAEDYIHLGIDAVVISEHMIILGNQEYKTSLSNSYATPFVTALVSKEMLENGTCNIHDLKTYIRKKSYISMRDDLYNPDWVYMAYMKNKKNRSQADYYFEITTGYYENVKQKVDTIIAFSKSELEQVAIENKNLIYLGEDDICNIDVKGFFWSKEIRKQQILCNSYQGRGLEVPVVILTVDTTIDSFYMLTELKRAFASEGYNAYTIAMEPECVLYALEYMPKPLPDYELWKNFIESEVFYKQSDLVIWCVPVENKAESLLVYPDCDVEVTLNNDGKKTLVKFSFDGEKTEKTISILINKKGIDEIYHIIETKLTEDEDEQ